MDNHPISCYHLGHYFQTDDKHLQEQYKEHISDYHGWEQKGHADQWMLFTKNVSPRLSIDETALSNGELLYTIVTNKEGAIVARIKGTIAEDMITVLKKSPNACIKGCREELWILLPICNWPSKGVLSMRIVL